MHFVYNNIWTLINGQTAEILVSAKSFSDNNHNKKTIIFHFHLWCGIKSVILYSFQVEKHLPYSSMFHSFVGWWLVQVYRAFWHLRYSHSLYIRENNNNNVIYNCSDFSVWKSFVYLVTTVRCIILYHEIIIIIVIIQKKICRHLVHLDDLRGSSVGGAYFFPEKSSMTGCCRLVTSPSRSFKSNPIYYYCSTDV